MKDLATAFVKILGNKKAARQIYNIAGETSVAVYLHASISSVLHCLLQHFDISTSTQSMAPGVWHQHDMVCMLAGERFVTFDGIAKACAKAAGAPEPELVHFNAKEFDFGKEKPFPMRDQHFFASVDKVRLNMLCCPYVSLVM